MSLAGVVPRVEVRIVEQQVPGPEDRVLDVHPKIGVLEAIEQIGRPNVGLQFDFYHVQIMEGDLARRFEAALDDVVHVQISGVPERHEPSTGEVNYPYLFNLMDRLGYTGYVGCEYNPRAATLDGLGWLFD